LVYVGYILHAVDTTGPLRGRFEQRTYENMSDGICVDDSSCFTITLLEPCDYEMLALRAKYDNVCG
jgi:hypothetical protein